MLTKRKNNNIEVRDSLSSKTKFSWRQLVPELALGVLLGTFLTTAQAVPFFKDDFERATLNKSIGYINNQIQDQQQSNWDLYRTTRVWNAGANGLELQKNGSEGINAKSGNYRVELDTNANSSMYTKVNLVYGQSYNLKFHYRGRPKTTTTTQCVLIVFCTTQTTTTYVGGGLRTFIEGPFYSSGYYYVGDASDWTQANFSFVYLGETGEAKLSFEATGASDGLGTLLDDISLETSISGDLSSPSALTGILPAHVPGLVSNDPNRSDIITPVVIDKKAAIALGKALFWEEGVGSDHMACASCHFHAGADNRIKNQIDPGLNHSVASGSTFENTLSGNKSGPNYTLTKADFPFNPSNDDVASSAGTFSGDYQTSPNGVNEDACARAVRSIFHVNGIGTRNVEPRNTPTTINAAFNHRNFWDGRANNEFNGVSPFGKRDNASGIYVNKSNGLSKEKLRLKNSSLASQADGPPGSDFEMACRGRQFADIGRKLLNRKPLSLQTIAADDSVLSSLPSLIGSTGTYATLVQKAFAPEYWNGNCGSNCGTPNAGVSPATPYNHMEANFSMFFGIAVQMYEATLISDDTRFDKWKRSLVAPTASESRGESVFNSKGHCNACHKGPTMSNAAIFETQENVIEGMLMRNGRKAIYDTGYYNLGLVPTSYDIGVGGTDPWGNPLNFTRQYITDQFVDDFGVEPCKFDVDNGLCSNSSATERAKQSPAVDGAFKVPTLRNVALTGPYFHNGSKATLEQVVDFYNRGGDFDNADKHPDIQPLGLSDQEKADLVAFLKSFTDDRVAYEKAPFDHPSLLLPNGHVGDQNQVTPGNPLLAQFAQEEIRAISAVGQSGRSQALPTFEAGLPNGTSVPPVATPSYALSLSTSTISIPSDWFFSKKATDIVTITPSNGFSGTVNFTISGLPSGVTASFSPSSVAGSGSSTLTLTKAPKLNLILVQTTLTVTATSGGITKTAPITLWY